MTGGSGVELLLDAKVKLGESPVWDPHLSAFWWIDCIGRKLHGLDLSSGRSATMPVGAAIHSIGVRSTGGLVAAMTPGFCVLDPDTGTHTVISHPEEERPEFHFNDGKCSPDGRFWVGSMHKGYEQAAGQLFKLGPDDVIASMMTGFTVPNGLGWSPDETKFYIADSPSGAIFQFDSDRHGGSLRRRTILAGPGEAPGWPDGMAVDEDGCLWSARWDGGCLVRFTPDGVIDRIVDLPVSRPTSCAFVGESLDILVVTSATAGLDEASLARQPMAGGIFALNPGVRGAPVGMFDGPSSFWHAEDALDAEEERARKSRFGLFRRRSE